LKSIGGAIGRTRDEDARASLISQGVDDLPASGSVPNPCDAQANELSDASAGDQSHGPQNKFQANYR
jgi:hypothetical protein